jgi:hypothetical protein
MADSTCIGCGCTDSQACEGDCHWMRHCEEQRVGICSASRCQLLVPVWDVGLTKAAPVPRGRRRPIYRGTPVLDRLDRFKQ